MNKKKTIELKYSNSQIKGEKKQKKEKLVTIFFFFLLT